mgnify:CR=1 FL=1
MTMQFLNWLAKKTEIPAEQLISAFVDLLTLFFAVQVAYGFLFRGR